MELAHPRDRFFYHKRPPITEEQGTFFFAKDGTRLGPYRPKKDIPIEDGARMPPPLRPPQGWDGDLKRKEVNWSWRFACKSWSSAHAWRRGFGIHDLLAQKYKGRRFGVRFYRDATPCDLDGQLSKVMIDVGKWAVGCRFGRF